MIQAALVLEGVPSKLDTEWMFSPDCHHSVMFSQEKLLLNSSVLRSLMAKLI